MSGNTDLSIYMRRIVHPRDRRILVRLPNEAIRALLVSEMSIQDAIEQLTILVDENKNTQICFKMIFLERNALGTICRTRILDESEHLEHFYTSSRHDSIQFGIIQALEKSNDSCLKLSKSNEPLNQSFDLSEAASTEFDINATLLDSSTIIDVFDRDLCPGRASNNIEKKNISSLCDFWLVDVSKMVRIYFNNWTRMVLGLPMTYLDLYASSSMQSISQFEALVTESVENFSTINTANTNIRPTKRSRFALFSSEIHSGKVKSLKPDTPILEIIADGQKILQWMARKDSDCNMGITRKSELFLHKRHKGLFGTLFHSGKRERVLLVLQGSSLHCWKYQENNDVNQKDKKIIFSLTNVHKHTTVYRGASGKHNPSKARRSNRIRDDRSSPNKEYIFEIFGPTHSESHIFSSPSKQRIEKWVRALGRCRPPPEIHQPISEEEAMSHPVQSTYLHDIGRISLYANDSFDSIAPSNVDTLPILSDGFGDEINSKHHTLSEKVCLIGQGAGLALIAEVSKRRKESKRFGSRVCEFLIIAVKMSDHQELETIRFEIPTILRAMQQLMETMCSKKYSGEQGPSEDLHIITGRVGELTDTVIRGVFRIHQKLLERLSPPMNDGEIAQPSSDTGELDDKLVKIHKKIVYLIIKILNKSLKNVTNKDLDDIERAADEFEYLESNPDNQIDNVKSGRWMIERYRSIWEYFKNSSLINNDAAATDSASTRDRFTMTKERHWQQVKRRESINGTSPSRIVDILRSLNLFSRNQKSSESPSSTSDVFEINPENDKKPESFHDSEQPVQDQAPPFEQKTIPDTTVSDDPENIDLENSPIKPDHGTHELLSNSITKFEEEEENGLSSNSFVKFDHERQETSYKYLLSSDEHKLKNIAEPSKTFGTIASLSKENQMNLELKCADSNILTRRTSMPYESKSAVAYETEAEVDHVAPIIEQTKDVSVIFSIPPEETSKETLKDKSVPLCTNSGAFSIKEPVMDPGTFKDSASISKITEVQIISQNQLNSSKESNSYSKSKIMNTIKKLEISNPNVVSENQDISQTSATSSASLSSNDAGFIQTKNKNFPKEQDKIKLFNGERRTVIIEQILLDHILRDPRLAKLVYPYPDEQQTIIKNPPESSLKDSISSKSSSQQVNLDSETSIEKKTPTPTSHTNLKPVDRIIQNQKSPIEESGDEKFKYEHISKIQKPLINIPNKVGFVKAAVAAFGDTPSLPIQPRLWPRLDSGTRNDSHDSFSSFSSDYEELLILSKKFSADKSCQDVDPKTLIEDTQPLCDVCRKSIKFVEDLLQSGRYSSFHIRCMQCYICGQQLSPRSYRMDQIGAARCRADCNVPSAREKGLHHHERSHDAFKLESSLTPTVHYDLSL